MLGVAIVAVLFSQKLKSVDLGNGLTARFLPDKVSEGINSAYSTELEIDRDGKAVGNLRTRTLLEDWLRSDDFWGGHERANQMRYGDKPNDGYVARLQGQIYEVVPVPEGCLVRIGLVTGGSPNITSGENLILRWRENQPNRWDVWEREQGGFRERSETIRLPRYDGKQFLISHHSVYRLSGSHLTKTLVAKLPTTIGWYAMSQKGPRLIITLDPEMMAEQPYFELNLNTGKLQQVSEADVFGPPQPKPSPPPEEELPNPMWRGMMGRSPTLPPQLDRDGSGANWARWIKIIGDPNRTMKERNIALIEMMNLVTPWSHGPWTSDVVSTIHQVIRKGPRLLRLGAIRTVRAWIYNWPQQVQGWTKKEVSLVQAIIDDPIFQQEIYTAANRPNPGNEYEAGPILMNPRNPNAKSNPDFDTPVNTTTIVWLATSNQAIAIMKTPKAFQWIKAEVNSTAPNAMASIPSLGYFPLKDIKDLVYRLAAEYYYVGKGKRRNLDWPGGVFGNCVIALARAGETHFDPFVKVVVDPSFDEKTRSSMISALAFFADESTSTAFAKVATDPKESESLSYTAINAFASLPELRAKRWLEFIIRTAPNQRVKDSATSTLKNWQQLRKSIEEEMGRDGFGDPGRNR